MELNVAKSFYKSFEEISESGLDILGSHVGNLNSRRDFLIPKIESLEGKVSLMRGLPRQVAYQILRVCMAQDLRHLLRQLNPLGLEDLWVRVDRLFVETLDGLRNAGRSRETDRIIYSLPISLGGLGLASHSSSSEFARQACVEGSSEVWSNILNNRNQPRGQSDVESQRDRIWKMHTREFEELLGALGEKDRLSFVDNKNKVMNAVLVTVPTELLIRVE